jgi:CTP:molybdopterin cytidylyltransferase MocA
MSYTIGGLPRLYGLVPCAGSGLRAGTDGPKQYAPLAGRPLVAHTLEVWAGLPEVEATLVVLAPDDDRFEQLVPQWQGPRCWSARVGGATRAESVAAGLAELAQRGVRPHDWVLVHDAARGLLQPQWVRRLMTPVATTRWAACWRCRWPTRSSRPVPKSPPAWMPPWRAPASGPHRHRRCSAWACCASRWPLPGRR